MTRMFSCYYGGIGIADMREVEWVDFVNNDDSKVRVGLITIAIFPCGRLPPSQMRKCTIETRT